MPNRVPPPPSPRAVSRTADGDRQEAGAEAMRQAFRRHAAGVTIVTLAGRRGPVGFTATSVASLSEQPPLLALALSIRSSIAPTLRAAETLLVHLLGQDQQDLAERFAAPGVDRFAAPTRWRPLATGEPLLLDPPTWLRCRIRERTATGDHWLVVAEILESRVDASAEPLVYHDGGYGTILKADKPTGPEAARTAAAPKGTAAAPKGAVGGRSAAGAERRAGGTGPAGGGGAAAEGDLGIRGRSTAAS